MMDYEDLDSYRQTVLIEVAKNFKVELRSLWECYLEVMKSNFSQDLWDIAKENTEELREWSEE